MADFASRLWELRTTRGLRQQDLAEKLGLSQSAIANYEKKLRFPDETTLGMIADFFGASMDFLLGRTDGALESGRPSRSANGPPGLAGLAKEYFERVRRGETEAAFHALNDTLSGPADVDEIYLRVVAPCLREIGRSWAAGQTSVAQEHYFTEATRRILARLHPAVRTAYRPKQGRRSVVFAVYGEMHLIGAQMVCDFLEMGGWDADFLGGNLSIRHALGALVGRPVDLLCVSVSLAQNIGAAEDLISAIRREPPLDSMKVLIGGQALESDSSLWSELGADGTAVDAAAAAREADRLFGLG
jgi:MerR family transcriptional regulator, light-induced transcriptional regulator